MHQHPETGGVEAVVHSQMQMQMQVQMNNCRQVGGGHFGSDAAANGQYENRQRRHFLGREAQQPAPHHSIGGLRIGGIQHFVEDLEPADGNGDGNRKILTLFPTGDD
ncbi:hypothetical protein MLD38_025969 [Melastoma candidum]|nr:hypothetical protein MLD38_025969 [Melastoma candidum]